MAYIEICCHAVPHTLIILAAYRTISRELTGCNWKFPHTLDIVRYNAFK